MSYKFRANDYTKTSIDHSNVWVIGDVHGCAKEFDQLCSMIKQKDKYATIVQAGDLIDRGPYLKEVFDVVEKYNVIPIIGNHELNFSLERHGLKKCGSKARQVSHDLFEQYHTSDQEKILSIISGSLNYVLVDNKWIISHAPVRNVGSIEYPNSAWSYCSRTQPYDFLELEDQLLFAVHGHQHWNYKNIDEQVKDFRNAHSNSINVDGGCVYGGDLVAFHIGSKHYLTVKGKEYVKS